MNMTISAEARALMALDPDFNTALAKQQPNVGDVHVSSTGSKKRKPLAFVGDITEVPSAKTFEEIMGATAVDMAKERMAVLDRQEVVALERIVSGDLEDILESFDATVAKVNTPALKPHPDGGAHVPFPYDAQALDKIDPKHMRMFLGAMTSPDDLPTRRVPIKSLVAVQPRVSPEKVADMQAGGYAKLPTVVRNDGKNLLVDGNHRASASLLDGESAIDCKYLRLSGEDESLAKIEDAEFKFVIKSADEDQQLIFGWASIVQKGDFLIIDKQGDMILPEELEKAAYDFLLEGGRHGHLHTSLTGRPVESMVFTKEKQAALGVVIKDAKSGEQIVGWWTGFKVDDQAVWAKHKNGELPEFSIGGASMSLKMDD